VRIVEKTETKISDEKKKKYETPKAETESSKKIIERGCKEAT
jgi:hypothetical protein